MLGVATVDVVNVNGEGVVVCGRIPYHCKTPVNSVCNGADLHVLSDGAGRLKSVRIPHVHVPKDTQSQALCSQALLTRTPILRELPATATRLFFVHTIQQV